MRSPEAGSKGLTFRIQEIRSGMGVRSPTRVFVMKTSMPVSLKEASTCVVDKYIESSGQFKSSLLCLCKSD